MATPTIHPTTAKDPYNMLKLTPMQRRALRWLAPGTWWKPALPVVTGLRSLAKHRPDLVEVRLLRTEHGPMAEYRLTQEGEKVRSWLKGLPRAGL